MKKIYVILMLAGPVVAQVAAQVNVRFTPEPMAIPTAQLGGAHELGRWLIEACNDGAAPVTLTPERIDMAAGPIEFIDADDTLIALTSAQRRSAASTVARVAGILGESAAIGAAIAKTNPIVSTFVAVGSASVPQMVTIAKGQIPAITPLISEVKYPVTLPPGGCFTDHRFAAKMPRVHVFTTRIDLPHSQLPARFELPATAFNVAEMARR